MVWVLTGQVQNRPDDEAGVVPAETQHWLRPNRSYRLGRMAHTAKPPKPGVKGAEIKPKMVDFALKSTSVSKDGAWEVRCEGSDWDEVDRPGEDGNDAPYRLVLKAIRKLSVISAGEQIQVGQDDEHELLSGDLVKFTTKYTFRVDWVPLTFCITSATKSEKAAYAKQAKAMGIKLAYQTFLPHHTHLVTSRIIPSTNLCLAAMSTASITNPKYLADLFKLATPPPRPSKLPKPPTPLTANESQEASIVKSHASKMTQWEQHMVELDPDVGSDWERWFGKSELEKDWNARPRETEEDGRYQPQSDGYLVDKWSPEVRRRSLWRGVMVISFRRDKEANEADRQIFELGGGVFLASEGLDSSATVASLSREIERHQESFPDHDFDRYAIIPPTEDWNVKPQPHEIPEQRVLRELAQRLDVTSYLSPASTEIVDAVYNTDAGALFPAPAFEVDATPQTVGGGPPSSPVGSMPMPTSRTVVGATYPQSSAAAGPESMELSPVAKRTRTHDGVAEPSQPPPPQQASQPAVVPVAVPAKKKLVRRAKTVQTQGMDLDEQDVFGSSAAAASETQPGIGLTAATQQSRLGASLGPTTSATQVVDPILTQTVAPTTARKLKRRAGTFQDQPLSFLEQAAKDSPISKKARATPEPEVIAEVPESDGEEDVFDRVQRERREKEKREAAKRRVGEGGPSDGEVGTPKPASKRARVPIEDSPPPTPAPTRRPPPATQAERSRLLKELKEKKEKAEEQLMLMKEVKRKDDKVKDTDHFTKEFNKLKLVRPTLKYARPAARDRMKWNDVDEEEEERRRLVEEDDEMMEHPDLWRPASQSMFVVKTLSTQNRGPARARDDLVVDPKWAGRPNFKKFKPKNQQAVGIPRQATVKIALAAPEPVQVMDYGVGPTYASHKKASRKEKADGPRRHLTQVLEEASDDDEDERPRAKAKRTATKTQQLSQSTLNFRSQPKATASRASSRALSDEESGGRSQASTQRRGKGKGKALVEESEEDELMDDDEGGGRPSQTPTMRGSTASAVSTARKGTGAGAGTQGASSTATGRSQAARRQPEVIEIDDSDSESDDGQTFKGFGGSRNKRR